ncbi:phosphoribosylglycinamide formyltransferase [Candidatus Ruminimicrobiellum ovillum]|uniref:phosphoribosylglycinamide formyltransferase n=1 Tax=Candidatus Ruminimicrobiellum ovillum TaxID=1947927 RepID=UPI003559E961
MKKLAVLVSGGGSNLQSIIDSTKSGILKNIAEVVIVISNNPSAYGLERAKKENIKAVALDYKNMDKQDYDDKMYKLIKESGADIICLAGYLKKVSDKIVKEYKSRILNIHPALLPKFGGKGMYGHFVHEAVVKAKEKKSGPTVHYVDENYDTGSIILQKEVPVYETDSPEDVAARVLVQEHIIFPQAIKKVIEKLNG